MELLKKLFSFLSWVMKLSQMITYLVSMGVGIGLLGYFTLLPAPLLWFLGLQAVVMLILRIWREWDIYHRDEAIDKIIIELQENVVTVQKEVATLRTDMTTQINALSTTVDKEKENTTTRLAKLNDRVWNDLNLFADRLEEIYKGFQKERNGEADPHSGVANVKSYGRSVKSSQTNQENEQNNEKYDV